MEVTHIKTFDLSSTWYRAVKTCLEKGYERPVFRGARQGAKRKELDFVLIEIDKPNNKPIVARFHIGKENGTEGIQLEKMLEIYARSEKVPVTFEYLPILK